MKRLLAALEEEHPGTKANILAAIVKGEKERLQRSKNEWQSMLQG